MLAEFCSMMLASVALLASSFSPSPSIKMQKLLSFCNPLLSIHTDSVHRKVSLSQTQFLPRWSELNSSDRGTAKQVNKHERITHAAFAYLSRRHWVSAELNVLGTPTHQLVLLDCWALISPSHRRTLLLPEWAELDPIEKYCGRIRIEKSNIHTSRDNQRPVATNASASKCCPTKQQNSLLAEFGQHKL